MKVMSAAIMALNNQWQWQYNENNENNGVSSSVMA
jgi:hypothetical protein